MKFVELFTDGACSGNPGKGGWGAILRYEALCPFHCKYTSKSLPLKKYLIKTSHEIRYLHQLFAKGC